MIFLSEVDREQSSDQSHKRKIVQDQEASDGGKGHLNPCSFSLLLFAPQKKLSIGLRDVRRNRTLSVLASWRGNVAF